MHNLLLLELSLSIRRGAGLFWSFAVFLRVSVFLPTPRPFPVFLHWCIRANGKLARAGSLHVVLLRFAISALGVFLLVVGW